MSSRLNKLFDLVCLRGHSISVEEAARQAQVSNRTIYNDVKRLNALLASRGLPEITNKQGELSYSEQISVPFTSLVDTQELIYLDPCLRRKMVAQALCKQADNFSLDDLSKELNIPRNTLMRDLSSLRDELAQQGIKLEATPFKGWLLKGDEQTIRSFYLSMLLESNQHFEGLRPDADIPFIDAFSSIIFDISEELSVSFSDTAINRLLAVFYVARTRISLGKSLQTSDNSFCKSVHELETREHELVQKYARRIALSYGLSDIPDIELCFIADHLRKSSVIRYEDLLSENWLKISLLTHEFIAEVAKQYPLAELEKDERLFQGLVNHLRPAYWRAYSQDQLQNPMLSYVCSEHSELHACVREAVRIIEVGLQIEFIESEIAFFTLFFAASLERRQFSMKQVKRVALVCQEGIATSQILRARLEALYQVSILGIFSIREIKSWLKSHEVDLLLSTVPVSADLSFESSELKAIVVSPQLNKEDRELLDDLLRPKEINFDADELLEIISRHVGLDRQARKSIKADLTSYFATTTRHEIQEARYEPMLKEVLTKEVIECGFHAVDRDAAVRQAGRLLVNKGVAEPKYVEAMIENVEVNGNYIVIAPGIAMPHARPEKGAKGIGFSLVTLAEPVVFGHPSNDPVKLVIGLCALDHQAHLKALAELSELLMDSGTVSKIEQAKKPEEILALIEGSK